MATALLRTRPKPPASRPRVPAPKTGPLPRRFCDFDRDDHLDLYVVRYVVYDRSVKCTDMAGRREYCGPDSFVDRTDVLLRNLGDGTFRDVTSQAGIDEVTGAGLGVVCEDFDDDGWMDIYVANDGDPNQLWMNQRDGTFIDDALIMGASVNASGLYEAGMGVVAADFDNDADLDLFLTHLRDETNTFYRNLGSGLGFQDHTTQAGLAAASTPYTGFGTAPIDLDLDGDLDLVIANGRVKRSEPLTDSSCRSPGTSTPSRTSFIANDGGCLSTWPGEPRSRPSPAPIEVGRGTGGRRSRRRRRSRPGAVQHRQPGPDLLEGQPSLRRGIGCWWMPSIRVSTAGRWEPG